MAPLDTSIPLNTTTSINLDSNLDSKPRINRRKQQAIKIGWELNKIRANRIYAARRVIRVKFISICRGGSPRRSSTPSPSPFPYPPLPPPGEWNGWKSPRTDPQPSPRDRFSSAARVSLLASFRGRAVRRYGGGKRRGEGKGLVDGRVGERARSDYWTRGSSTSKLRRIDRINLPPRRNIKAKDGGGGGCLDGRGGSNDLA